MRLPLGAIALGAATGVLALASLVMWQGRSAGPVFAADGPRMGWEAEDIAVGTVVNFGFRGLVLTVDKPVTLRSVRLASVPDELEVVAIHVLEVPPSNGIGWVAGSLERYGDDFLPVPVDGAVVHPSDPAGSTQLAVTLRPGTPGVWEARDLVIDYEDHRGRSGTQRLSVTYVVRTADEDEIEHGQRRHEADVDGDGLMDIIEVSARTLSEAGAGLATPVVTVQFASGAQLSVDIDDEVPRVGSAPWIPGHVDLGNDGRNELFIIGSGETGVGVAVVGFDPATARLFQATTADEGLLGDGLLSVGNGASFSHAVTCRDDGRLEQWSWHGSASGRRTLELIAVYELVGARLEPVRAISGPSSPDHGRLDCPHAIDPGV